MPVYEYKCTECTDRFEIEQRISDDPLKSLAGCPAATDGSHRLKKVFSSIGISFKGDGFYRNDARGSKKPARSSAGSESSGDSSGDAKSSSGSSGSESSASSNGGTDKKSTPAAPAAASASSSSD